MHRPEHRVSGYVRLLALTQHGSMDAARLVLRELRPTAPPTENVYLDLAEAVIDGVAFDAKVFVETLRRSGFRDPEGWAYFAVMLVHAGARDEAMAVLDEVVAGGFMFPLIRNQPWLAPLAGDERFERVMRRAEEGRAAAAEAFKAARGHRLLGLTN